MMEELHQEILSNSANTKAINNNKLEDIVSKLSDSSINPTDKSVLIGECLSEAMDRIRRKHNRKNAVFVSESFPTEVHRSMLIYRRGIDLYRNDMWGKIDVDKEMHDDGNDNSKNVDKNNMKDDFIKEESDKNIDTDTNIPNTSTDPYAHLDDDEYEEMLVKKSAEIMKIPDEEITSMLIESITDDLVLLEVHNHNEITNNGQTSTFQAYQEKLLSESRKIQQENGENIINTDEYMHEKVIAMILKKYVDKSIEDEIEKAEKKVKDKGMYLYVCLYLWILILNMYIPVYIYICVIYIYTLYIYVEKYKYWRYFNKFLFGICVMLALVMVATYVKSPEAEEIYKKFGFTNVNLKNKKTDKIKTDNNYNNKFNNNYKNKNNFESSSSQYKRAKSRHFDDEDDEF